ncbi:MAG TPA: PilZ domain-containing protein [Nitrospira sp.]|nr:PilZ domain-containing protein [Nitrospira sp.]
MPNHRHLYRLAIDRIGHLERSGETFRCKVMDMTEQGVRLWSDGTFRVGEELRLTFALTETELLTCTIHVTHSEPPHIGASISRIDPDDQHRLSSFIEQLNALNMPGF